jgi:hypothetical protein
VKELIDGTIGVPWWRRTIAPMNTSHGPEISAWSGGVCLLLALATLERGAEQAGLLLLGGAVLLFVWAAFLGRAGG